MIRSLSALRAAAKAGPAQQRKTACFPEREYRLLSITGFNASLDWIGALPVQHTAYDADGGPTSNLCLLFRV